LEPKKPHIAVDPLPEVAKPIIETFPGAEEIPGLNALPEPLPEEETGLHTTAPMVPEEGLGNILTAEDGSIPQIPLELLPENVQESFRRYDDHGWKGNVPGQAKGTNAGRGWANREGQLPSIDADGNPITYREFDVNDYNGIDRGTERFVVGSDGSVYYTDSHYGQSTSINGIDDFVKLN
jgi:guanyl-specific ribonuclease Sa